MKHISVYHLLLPETDEVPPQTITPCVFREILAGMKAE